MKILIDLKQRIPRISGGSSLNTSIKLIEEMEKENEISNEKLVLIKENVLHTNQPTYGRKLIQDDICLIIDKALEVSDRNGSKGVEGVDGISDETLDETQTTDAVENEVIDENEDFIMTDAKVIVEVEDEIEEAIDEIEDEIEDEKVEDEIEEESEKEEIPVVKLNLESNTVEAKVLGKKQNVTKTFAKKNQELLSDNDLTEGMTIYLNTDYQTITAYWNEKLEEVSYFDKPLAYKK